MPRLPDELEIWYDNSKCTFLSLYLLLVIEKSIWDPQWPKYENLVYKFTQHQQPTVSL